MEITYTYIRKERLAKKGGGVVRFTMYNWIIVDCCAFLEKKRLFMRKIAVKMCKKRQVTIKRRIIHHGKGMYILKCLKYWSAAILMLLLLVVAVEPAAAVEGDNGGENVLQDTAQYVPVDEIVYSTGEVNVRSGPGTQYKRIGGLSYAEAIRRTGIGSNGWSKVMFGGETAYVFTELLTTTKPSGFQSGVDETALRAQLAIANGLRSHDYTRQTWAAVDAALGRVDRTLSSGSQTMVDQLTDDLRAAIAALKKVDYSFLETSLTAVDTFTDNDRLSELRMQLAAAEERGKELLTSGDQEAVDACAKEIYDLLVAIKEEMKAQNITGTVIQEVTVEVMPVDDYCNMTQHRAWQILFFVALALDLGFAAMIFCYVQKKKRMVRQDDTPLVDYDIDDDAF